MADVRLNPWIPGSQPQITHARFSAVSSWTLFLPMPPIQLQADEGIPPTPQSNSLHYTLPLLQQSGAILQSPAGTCDQNESSRAQFTGHHWSTSPQLAFRSKSLIWNKTKTSALINAGCFKKIFCSPIFPAKCHHSCKGEPRVPSGWELST